MIIGILKILKDHLILNLTVVIHVFKFQNVLNTICKSIMKKISLKLIAEEKCLLQVSYERKSI